MPNRIVFIASLGHSGSTVLDLALGTHPQMAGLGEFGRFLSDGMYEKEKFDPTTRCSCGNAVAECPFWGPLREDLLRHENLSAKHAYRTVLRAFDAHFGKDTILVDSSKMPKYLEYMARIPDVDLRVLFLLRDVRSWSLSVSAIRRHKARGLNGDSKRAHPLRRMMNYPRHTRTALFLEWRRENERLRAQIVRQGLSFFQLGYEELALCPERMLPLIYEFLDVDPSQGTVALTHSRSHCVLGNRMRTDPRKRQRIMYDNRWFQNNAWLLPWLLLPGCRRFNREEVYRNSAANLWTS